MKKVLLGLLCLAVCLTVVLSCEIPESVIVKGSPGLRISLNPFDLLGPDQKRLEDYISTEEIKNMMAESDTSGAKVYEYNGTEFPGVQTYVVHYPIAKMNLDLEQYIQDAIGNDHEAVSYDIPAQISSTPQESFPTGGYYLVKDGPRTTPGDPLFTVALKDMAKLVQHVKGGPFGFQIAYDENNENHQKLKDNLRVTIPAFGMDPNNYAQGVVVDTSEGKKLRFWNSDKTSFWPHGNPNSAENLTSAGPLKDGTDELEIFVKVLGPCSGTIDLDLAFEWTEVTIYTVDNDKLKGNYPISNTLGSFLGEGVDFNRVDGYIYVNGVGNKARMSLDFDNDSLLTNPDTNGELPLAEHPKPSFPDDDAPFKDDATSGKKLSEFGHSLTDPINLVDILNAPPRDDGEPVKLEYQIKIDTMTIQSTDTKPEVTIDLVIFVPLQLTVSSVYDTDYVKLDLGDTLSDLGKGDLFGRGEGKDKGNDLLDKIDIKKVTATLQNPINTVFDGNLSILMSSNNRLPKRLDFAPNAKLEFDGDDLKAPFIPELTILLKKDTGKNSATLTMKRQTPNVPAKFDFSLDVTAQTNVDIDLADL